MKWKPGGNNGDDVGDYAPVTSPPIQDQQATLQLTKHHGLGNDFLIGINPERALTATDARSLCDRRSGVGADGLIGLSAFGQGWRMVLFNSDGSRAELSGNGLRCVGQALAMHAGLKLGPNESHSFAVITDAGPRGVVVYPDQAAGVAGVKVAMGRAEPGPEAWDRWDTTEVVPKRQMTVNVGNPHLVVEVDDPMSVELGAIGPLIEADYPEGINVHFIAANNDDGIDLRVWERGAGITLACGSGACAAAYAAKEWGLVSDTVEVHQPGGTATVLLDTDQGIALIGPAAYVATVLVNAQ